MLKLFINGFSDVILFLTGSNFYVYSVAKMASHAMFQYNVLAIDDTHNTWTNMIVKINIPRLLGSSDDKEKIGAARPEGPPLRGFRYPVSGRGSRGSRYLFGPKDKNRRDCEEIQYTDWTDVKEKTHAGVIVQKLETEDTLTG